MIIDRNDVFANCFYPISQDCLDEYNHPFINVNKRQSSKLIETG